MVSPSECITFSKLSALTTFFRTPTVAPAKQHPHVQRQRRKHPQSHPGRGLCGAALQTHQCTRSVLVRRLVLLQCKSITSTAIAASTGSLVTLVCPVRSRRSGPIASTRNAWRILPSKWPIEKNASRVSRCNSTSFDARISRVRVARHDLDTWTRRLSTAQRRSRPLVPLRLNPKNASARRKSAKRRQRKTRRQQGSRW